MAYNNLHSITVHAVISTPTGSPVDLVSAETQYEYAWADKDRQIIEACKNHLKGKLACVEKLQYQGPTGEPWPKEPKTDIKLLDPPAKGIKSRKLCGPELHDYLVEHCADSAPIVFPATPEGGFSSLEKMRKHLQAGWNKLKQLNSNALAWHIEYGHWLNLAFAQYELDKMAGIIDGTWEEWLKENVSISAPQGRKIRAVARLLMPYPRFLKLGLSFPEVYSLRNQIEAMLFEIQPWAAYWKQA